MNFGIAGIRPPDSERVKIAKQIGFSFVESKLSALQADFTDHEIVEFAELLNELCIPCISTNGMFPGDIKLIGKEADRGLIENYLYEAFEKIKPLNTKICVLGSGAARTIDDISNSEQAYDEFASLLSDVIAPIFEKYEKILAIEPLNYNECNIVNTVADSMRVVKAVNSKTVTTLIDFYHVGVNGEDVKSFSAYNGYISHVHIASAKNNRKYPAYNDGENYREFFEVLTSANYSAKNISIEGSYGSTVDEFEERATESFKLMSELCKGL